MRRKYAGMASVLFLVLFIGTLSPSVEGKARHRHRKKQAQASYRYDRYYRFHHPADYERPAVERLRFREAEVVIDLYAQSFTQGNAAYLEVFLMQGHKDKKLVVHDFSFDGTPHPVLSRSWGFRSVFPIPPDCAPGVKRFVVGYTVGGSEREASHEVTVADAGFPVFWKALDLGINSNVEFQEKPENVAFIERCAMKKKEAFAVVSPDCLDGSFAHPRNLHYVTSLFWSKRHILQYRMKEGKRELLPDAVKVHRGIDLRGVEGAPVHAMAPGKVLLAEPMFYEGNFVLIDHGNQVFSYYMHMSRIEVSPGDSVKAGRVIGRVGSTGLSTAAHLHVSLAIRGTQVNPLSILGLPVRD